MISIVGTRETHLPIDTERIPLTGRPKAGRQRTGSEHVDAISLQRINIRPPDQSIQRIKARLSLPYSACVSESEQREGIFKSYTLISQAQVRVIKVWGEVELGIRVRVWPEVRVQVGEKCRQIQLPRADPLVAEVTVPRRGSHGKRVQVLAVVV